MAYFTHDVSDGSRTRMHQSNLVSPAPVFRQRKDLNTRVIQGCDFTIKDEICNNLVELASCPILLDIPEAENAVFVNHGIWDIQMMEQFLEYNRHWRIACPRTNVSLPRSKFQSKTRLSTGEATRLVQQCAGHPLTERQARSFLEQLMPPGTLRDKVSASNFVRGARRLKSEMEDKISDYENFIRRKDRGAGSIVHESSNRASRVPLSNGNSENHHASRLNPTRVQEESRYSAELSHSTNVPATVSPDRSLGHRSHISHTASNQSNAEPSVPFPTPLSPDYSSAPSQQNFLHGHSRRQHQSRAVSPEQDLDIQTAIALQNSLLDFSLEHDLDLQTAIALQNSLSMQRQLGSFGTNSLPSTVSPDRSLGHRRHISRRVSNRSSAESIVPFPTPVSPDYSSVQDADFRTADALQNNLSMQRQLDSFVSTHRSVSASAPQQRVSSDRVYIAASRKGKCFHSHETCSGLRSASSVTLVSLEEASDMLGMRPCKVCRPRWSMPREQQRPERLFQSSTPRTPEISFCAEVPSRSSPLLASDHSSQTYWITRTGQCYHSSRSCSSLRRSRVIMTSTGKPAGKRPCSKCC